MGFTENEIHYILNYIHIRTDYLNTILLNSVPKCKYYKILYDQITILSVISGSNTNIYGIVQISEGLSRVLVHNDFII